MFLFLTILGALRKINIFNQKSGKNCNIQISCGGYNL